MSTSGPSGRQRRLSSAHVIAIVAVVLAMVTGAYAAGLAKNTVGSKQIKPGAVKSSDLAQKAVAAGNLKGSATTTLFADDNEAPLSTDSLITIASLDLPKGSYLVTADVSATNTDTGSGTTVECSLRQANVTVDDGQVSLQSSAVSAGSPFPVTHAKVPLQSAVTLRAAGGVDVSCQSSLTVVDLDNIHLDAIRADARVDQSPST